MACSWQASEHFGAQKSKNKYKRMGEREYFNWDSSFVSLVFIYPKARDTLGH